MQGIAALRSAIAGAAEAVVEDACSQTCERARALCPVKTGALRSSITAAASGQSGEVRASAAYASAVELGTGGQPPRAFLQPAFAQVKGTVMAELARRIAQGS